MKYRLPVLVQLPIHSQVAGPLTYLSEELLEPGVLVRVPLGQREALGMVWGEPLKATEQAIDSTKLRGLGSVLRGLAPLNQRWRDLITFAAGYYQRALGEVALAALPPALRDVTAVQLERRLRIAEKASSKLSSAAVLPPATVPELSPDQSRVLGEFDAQTGPFCCLVPPAVAKPRFTFAVYRTCYRATPRHKRWSWCRRSTSPPSWKLASWHDSHRSLAPGSRVPPQRHE